MNENRRPSKPYCYTWHGESLIHDVEFTDRPLSYNARVVYFNLTGLDADQYRAALEAWWQAKFRAVDNWVLRSEYAELLAKWEAMSSVA